MILMQLRYNFRLEPAPGQCIALAKAFGCARVVYNDGLATRKAARASGDSFPKTSALMKSLITEAKRTSKRAWLSDAPVVVLQQALRDLDAAYQNLFASAAGSRKGP